MRITPHALCAMAALAHASGVSADFSWELAALFGHAEQSPDRLRVPLEEVDSDLVAVSATHYFDPVEEGSGPPALAAFFNPRTHLSVTSGDGQRSDEFFLGPNSGYYEQGEEEISDYALRGLYLFAESKWYAGGRYARREGERYLTYRSLNMGNGDGEATTDVEDYAVFAGKYFGTGATRLELSLGQLTTHNETSTRGFCRFVGGVCSTSSRGRESSFDTPTLAVMHVRQSRSATYALLGEVSEERFREGTRTFDDRILEGLGDPDPPWTYFVGAEWYPVPTIGIRLGYESLSDNFALERGEEDTVSIGASWFVRRNVGLELTLSRLNRDRGRFSGDLPSTNGAALRVIGRL